MEKQYLNLFFAYPTSNPKHNLDSLMLGLLDNIPTCWREGSSVIKQHYPYFQDKEFLNRMLWTSPYAYPFNPEELTISPVDREALLDQILEGGFGDAYGLSGTFERKDHDLRTLFLTCPGCLEDFCDAANKVYFGTDNLKAKMMLLRDYGSNTSIGFPNVPLGRVISSQCPYPLSLLEGLSSCLGRKVLDGYNAPAQSDSVLSELEWSDSILDADEWPMGVKYHHYQTRNAFLTEFYVRTAEFGKSEETRNILRQGAKHLSLESRDKYNQKLDQIQR